MAEQSSEDVPFVVKNSTGILIFIMVFCGFLFISSIPYGFNNVALVGGLLPALASIAGLINHKPLIIVDKNGIYASGRFITDWKHFAHAGIGEVQVTASFADHFILYIEYSKDGIEGYFKSSIALTNTENKSEEAVVAAIEFFYNNYKSKI